MWQDNNKYSYLNIKSEPLIHLNDVNGASNVTLGVAARCLLEFDNPIGCEMGIAYGGGVAQIGELWKPRNGQIYGFDTFEGHPKHLGATPNELETVCMDDWYREDSLGMDRLSYEYQRDQLDYRGLNNVHLVKGLVNENSCDDIPYLNYVFLDMDMEASTRLGFAAVDKKITVGGYLCLHDVIPNNHLPRIHKFFYNEVLPNRPDYKIFAEYPSAFLTVLKKIS